MIVIGSLYFDVASHASNIQISTHQDNNLISIDNLANILEDNPLSSKLNRHLTIKNVQNINNNDISITSNTAYMTQNKLDINHQNFINLLHRRSLGFDINEYNLMKQIIDEYAIYHTETIENDVNNGILNGKYIILTPAAQMCNRLRSLMATILLGILTKRIVFVDIGAEQYAQRLNGIFINPGFEWEYKQISSKLKTLLNSAESMRITFPYEVSHAKGIAIKQVCNNFGNPPGNNGKTVWWIESHAAYLPLIARNANIYNTILNYYEQNSNEQKTFDYYMASHFMRQIKEKGQEYIENLEVLLGRILYKLENDIQLKVDNIIKDAYNKATSYYKNEGLTINNELPPPIMGIHIRSEYVMSMNPKQCRGSIMRCDKAYKWFEDCGIIAMDINDNKNNISPFLFIAADTKDAQQMANNVFGSNRVYFRPFQNTGSSYEGIKEAVIDLISVSSFDVFVGTPHSSYSEMASILGQARRIYDNNQNKYYMKWNIDNNINNNNIPINRMIIPIMSTIDWEIDKLNKYTFGRTIDINLDDNNKVLIPFTSVNYKSNKICKQSIVAGMGWMGMFNDLLKIVSCYNKEWHHPGNWFS